MNSNLIATQSLAFAIIFLPAIVVVAIQKARKKSASWPMLGFAAIVFIAHVMALTLPQLDLFDGLHYNWQNKLLIAALTVAVLTQCSPEFRVRAGFTLPRGSWGIYTAIATAVILVISVGQGLSIDDPQPLTTETFLFQAIVPGIDEELIYRGVLFALFGLAFGIQTRSGLWAVLLITTVLFGLVHGFEWQNGTITFVPGPFAAASVIGFWLGWVRLYTGSVLPCIALHNLSNVVFVATASI